MKLRKAANNALFFRILYTDEKLLEIEKRLKKYQKEMIGKKKFFSFFFH
jgi:hypothetical protein